MSDKSKNRRPGLAGFPFREVADAASEARRARGDAERKARRSRAEQREQKATDIQLLTHAAAQLREVSGRCPDLGVQVYLTNARNFIESAICRYQQATGDDGDA